ncbi:hypothetical protein [Lysinibacillus pakistanensis]|uniref:Uncharacterized protein n=1 Tax=Lysinibacillus pakistanensis TaxID=759811 RepID=A0AAX3WV19_9BACI|nr:hypothetical protein [Lysinibacillus pakistanensis]MDM5229769.1 hypothetical protein [Lysinibacillus pakistanensis]WHY45372.1 hypothetical protein QNH22_18955 [Lysinibacillus pakistanensis]WHY50380.1 hypothetical protein QNH24_18920 [Lysinibacillus pakistanensis]
MYKYEELKMMNEEALREKMIVEHAYLEVDVIEYDKEMMIEILINIPTF